MNTPALWGPQGWQPVVSHSPVSVSWKGHTLMFSFLPPTITLLSLSLPPLLFPFKWSWPQRAVTPGEPNERGATYCLDVGCPVRTNNVLTQTLLVRIEQPTSKQQATNVPKTEKHNRSKFGVPMPLENILKCRSTVTLLERDDQTTPQISPYSP